MRWLLLVLAATLLATPGCVQKKPKVVIEEEEEDIGDEDTCLDDACVEDAVTGVDATPDVKKDVKDVKQDVAKEVDGTPVDTGTEVEEDVASTDDAEPDTDLDGDAAVQPGPDADSTGTQNDADADAQGPGSDADASAKPDADAGADADADSAAVDADSQGDVPDTGPIVDIVCDIGGDQCAKLPLPACIAGYECQAIEGKNACVAITADEGKPCTDSNTCTVGDNCMYGKSGGVAYVKCVGAPLVCNDSNPCTKDSCQNGQGCQFETSVMENTACTDGNSCTDGEVCKGGKCDFSAATKKCACKTDPDCKPYDDGNACNGKLICLAGFCANDGKSVKCDVGADNACQSNTCDTSTGSCNIKYLGLGTACSDGNACTSGDQCSDGKCVGKAVDCQDNEACTTDSCDASDGCKHANNSFLCNDGDSCTGGDVCSGGKCLGQASGEGGKPLCECQKSEECAKQDTPDNLCNGKHICVQNKCVLQAGSVVKCLYAKGVCFDTACDPATGQCKDTAKPATTLCTDSDACTVGEHCDVNGACATCTPGKDCTGANGVSELKCDDGNPCTDDSCNPFLGCVHIANEKPCDDANPCTAGNPGDRCVSGSCVPGQPSCECTSAADCDKLKSVNKCLTKSTCVLASDGTSQCLYDNTSIKVCTLPAGSNPACVVVFCNAATGNCGITKFTGPTCSDGDPCTEQDQCFSGVCEGVVKECDDKNTCTSDSCNAGSGSCSHDAAVSLEGTECVDGKDCTSGDLCSNGECVGAATKCDDANPCTLDSCVEPGGCKTTLYSSAYPACDDGDPCTGNPLKPELLAYEQDHCTLDAKCVGGVKKNCDDGGLCTDEVCSKTDPKAIQSGFKKGCVITNNVTPCNDGNQCSLGEHCTAGTCKLPADATTLDCDDKNACTVDSCKPIEGCIHQYTADPCDDGNICTTKDLCDGDTKSCKGVALNCDDQNACTIDSCDPKSTKTKPDGTLDGCKYAKNSLGNPCGGFAECSSAAVPSCIFPPGQHLLLSEVYLGVPADPSDDWVELYNPTTKTVDLGDYVVQKRAVAESDIKAWVTLAQLPKGVSIAPHGYFLVGHSGTAPGGIGFDLAVTTLDLAKDDAGLPSGEWQLRVYDTPHQLAHDFACWSSTQPTCNEGTTALPAMVTATQPWFSAGSLERKANAKSTRETMFLHASEWLAGNGYDTGDSSQDFVVRWGPEPQNGVKAFEPACAGTCASAKVCDFKAGGLDSCVADPFCAIGCGSGKACKPSGCFSLHAAMVSEVYPGTDAGQFIEIHNGNAQATDFSGFVVQTKPAGGAPTDKWLTITQFPAGSSLPAFRYLTIAGTAWAEQNGGVDLVIEPSIAIVATGGVLRIWDPRTDTEMDLMGWGNSGTFSGKAAPALTKSNEALERKAKDGSTLTSMAAGGTDVLAGNAVDSDTDDKDWILNDGPMPQSLASGVYEPACNGTCTAGLDCNYTKTAEKCVDPSCGGQCNTGAACNPKTGVCDLYVLIAEYAAIGPVAKDQLGGNLDLEANEYVLLYNPTGSAVNLFGLALQYYNYTASKWQALTDYGCTQGTGDPNPTTGWCLCTDGTQPDKQTGACSKPGSAAPKRGLAGYVEPYSYYLIAPPKYDATLPTPDFITSMASGPGTWSVPSDNAGYRLVRIEKYYPNGKNVADWVTWGNQVKVQGQGGCSAPAQMPSPPGPGVKGAGRRKPVASATAALMSSPQSATWYAGAGSQTFSSCNDFVAMPTATPASQKCTRAPRGGSKCSTSVVHQRP